MSSSRLVLVSKMVDSCARLACFCIGLFFCLAVWQHQAGHAYSATHHHAVNSDNKSFNDSAPHWTLNNQVLRDGTVQRESPSYLQQSSLPSNISPALELAALGQDPVRRRPQPVQVARTGTTTTGRVQLGRQVARVTPEELATMVEPSLKDLLNRSTLPQTPFVIETLRVFATPEGDTSLPYTMERILGAGAASIVIQAVQETVPQEPARRRRSWFSRLKKSHAPADTRPRVALRFPVVDVRKKQQELPEVPEAELLSQLAEEQLRLEIHKAALVSSAAGTEGNFDSEWGFALPFRVGRLSNEGLVLAMDGSGKAILNFVTVSPAMMCDLHTLRSSSRTPAMDEFVVMRVLQLAANLERLQLTHLDITDENVLVGRDGQLFLGGFEHVRAKDGGISCGKIPSVTFTDPRLAHCAVNNPGSYAAVNPAVDAWMAGMMLLRWFCGDVFFNRRSSLAEPRQAVQVLAQLQADFIAANDYMVSFPAFTQWDRCRHHVNERFQFIIQSLLDVNPYKRGAPSAQLTAYFPVTG
ncbi:rhoptry kinase family protein ROP11 (incomplete catalytic triad) [Toxoplasma gondii RUB]|uniref:Rhoptry kinase family protein ROP11 (Incomplete catalytic triad) n=1 Tax=Toxoplasma gondii RUB TaxID=935652 RepID=A0A086M9Q5_TOXGO|nr:rhoptry kinase family protein ROP11 (incomplete catalytic triad) [Toxoplasma gondii RUB]